MIELDEASGILSYATLYMFYGILSSAFTLLRLLKGNSFTHISENRESSESTFFSAVNLLRKMSVENDDLPIRNSLALSQLWTSKNLFMRSDGSKSSALRIRSRLAMSPVMDCLWWWREEFRGQKDTYPPFQISNKGESTQD